MVIAVLSSGPRASALAAQTTGGAATLRNDSDRVDAGEVSGVWIGREEIMRRPTSGAEWEGLVRDAERDPGIANIADQDSQHDVFTLAAALVCVRVGRYCDKARRGVLDAIGTEATARWLAVGRNLGSYVITADLLGLRAGAGADGDRVERWIRGWLTVRLKDNNDSTTLRPIAPYHSGSNAAAQEGFVYTAVAAYLHDASALSRAWNGFRAFVCDSGAPQSTHLDLVRAVRDGWAHDDRRPCAINPAGAVKTITSTAGVRTVPVGGAIIADMRRGGPFQPEPIYTAYPWIGLEGLVPAAVVLERAGYPAFEAGDRAILRANEYLWHLRVTTGDRRWFDGDRAREIVHLVNVAYDASLPVLSPVRAGRTVGYTAWTHPAL